MELKQLRAGVYRASARAIEGLKRLRTFQGVLVVACLSIPLLLYLSDYERGLRCSISAYYDMDEAQIYYFPLTVAAMLFVVNGVVRHKCDYNIFLGLMLGCVVLYNHDDWEVLHKVFAIAFFGGNAVVMLLYPMSKMPEFAVEAPRRSAEAFMRRVRSSSKKERRWKAALVAIIALALLGWKPFHLYELFWAEWLSFAIIALHYVLELYRGDEDQALAAHGNVTSAGSPS